LNVDTFRKQEANCKGEGFWLKMYSPRPTPFSAPPPGSKYHPKSEISPIK